MGCPLTMGAHTSGRKLSENDQRIKYCSSGKTQVHETVDAFSDFVTPQCRSLTLIMNTRPQYSEWTVGPLNSVTCAPMFMQFTGCHHPVKGFYWPENAN